MNASLSHCLLTAAIVCSLLFQSCQSGLRAITEEDPELKQERPTPAEHLRDASEALPSGVLALAPARADARVSGESPSELVSAVVPAYPQSFVGPFTASSGERVLLGQRQGQWQAFLQGGAGAVVHGHTLPVVGSGDINTLLAGLQGQDAWSSRSRIHVLSAPRMSSAPCVYIGKLGLLGGTEQSYTSAPVRSSPSFEKQLHSVVVIPPGKEVRIPYPFPLGWRYFSHYLHVVQEAPDASYHVSPLQANFSYSSSDQEGRNQHHSTSQVASGPSAGIPVLGVEADLQMGRHASQAQGAQHYATSSIRTTHDGLELHASVPRTYKKKGGLLGRYKDAPITQSLKLQLEVILERDGSTPSTPPASSPSHVRPQPVDRPGSASVAPPPPFIQKRPSSSLPARPTEFSFSSEADQGDTKPPAQAPAPAPAAYSFEEIEALLVRKLQDPDVVLNDAESIALLTHCVELGEENVGKVAGKEAIVILGNTGSGKSTFVNYLLGCEMLKKFPRELGMKGTAKVVVVRSKSEGGPLDEVMPIGHTKISKTFVPHIQADFDDPQLVYCDCPGFLDNRGAEVNIANAVNIRRLLQSSRGVKVLVLVNYHSLRAERARGLREMLQICTQLFGSSTQLTDRSSSLLLGISQVPSDEANLEGLRDWLLEDSPAVMTSLCERLFLYDPVDATSGDYLSRSSCLSALRGLKAIPQRDSDKLFHTVLTDSDERMLLSVVEKQGKQLRDHLRSERYGQAAMVWRNLNRLRVIDHISVERMLNDDSLKIQRMLSRRVAKFRDDSVHYRFSSAKSQLASLQDIARHFSAEDLYLFELDIADLSQHFSYFERKKAQEDEREAILHQLSDRLDAISQQRAMLEERLSSQSEASSKEQSRLRAEMVRRDADHELQVTRLREEQAEFLRKQAEAAELQQATSEEERTRQRKEREQMRKDYESRLRAAEEERKAVRLEYEKMLQTQEASKKAAEASLRKELSKLTIAEQQTQAVQQQVKLPSQAFGAKAWSQYFGDVGAEPSLPSNIGDTLNSTCPFWPGKQVKDTHLLVLIPAEVDGKPFSLNLLSELIQHPKGGGHATKYRNYGSDTQKQFGTQSPERPYWVLMTRDVLEGSRNTTYASQKALVAGHAKRTSLPYELPGALEAATAILSHHVRSGERLYTDNPLTYTRCRELEDGKYPVVVGGFSSGGLLVSSRSGDSSSSGDFGVAGFRKF